MSTATVDRTHTQPLLATAPATLDLSRWYSSGLPPPLLPFSRSVSAVFYLPLRSSSPPLCLFRRNDGSGSSSSTTISESTPSRPPAALASAASSSSSSCVHLEGRLFITAAAAACMTFLPPASNVCQCVCVCLPAVSFFASISISCSVQCSSYAVQCATTEAHY